MSISTDKRQPWLIASFLALAVLIVYWHAMDCDFVNYDDLEYVTLNTAIHAGVTWNCVTWAFTHVYSSNWHPLTWLSHAMDVNFYGLKPAGHHLTNVLLHGANTVLLFVLLRRLTGADWRSAWVAALFGLHPLHVESVAWVSERKDVLSTFFWILTILAWRAYVVRRRAREKRAWDFYALALVLYALGLMSKPMLVTLPFILVLLDYWPLERISFQANGQETESFSRLMVEKLPFFGLALLSSGITYWGQSHVGAVASLTAVPLVKRAANVPFAYVRYLGKMAWPSDLAVLYLFSSQLSAWAVWGSLALLGTVTGLVLWSLRRLPYLAVGWFWFLGMLVPTIGLVKVGSQALADRYTYVPSVGIFIIVAWLATSLAGDRTWAKRALAVAGGLAVAVCALLTERQVVFWTDSKSLFGHEVSVIGGSDLGWFQIGFYLAEQDDYSAAIPCLQASLRINPNRARTHATLGQCFFKQGQIDAAISELQTAIQQDPSLADAHYHLGQALMTAGQRQEALVQLQWSVNLQPRGAQAALLEYKSGLVLLQRDKVDEAIVHFRRAIDIRPSFAEAHYKLANALLLKNQPEEAVSNYEAAVEVRPDYAQAFNNLAWLLATSPNAKVRNGAHAVEMASKAEQLSGAGDPVIIGTLAAAYAEAGRFPEAVATTERASQLATGQGYAALADLLRTQLASYQAGKPWRDAAPTHP